MEEEDVITINGVRYNLVDAGSGADCHDCALWQDCFIYYEPPCVLFTNGAKPNMIFKERKTE